MSVSPNLLLLLVLVTCAVSQGEDPAVPEARIVLRWDKKEGRTVRHLQGGTPGASDDALMDAAEKLLDDARRAGQVDPPLLIDATDDVPWTDVIHVMDLAKQRGIERVEFTAPMESTAPERPREPDPVDDDEWAACDLPGERETGKLLSIAVCHRPSSGGFHCEAADHGETCKEPSHWRIRAAGRTFATVESMEEFLDADSKPFRVDRLNPRISEREVFIRGSNQGEFGPLLDVMEACTHLGIYRIVCGGGEPLRRRPATDWTPASEEQALALARTIEEQYARGSFRAFDDAIDREAILTRGLGDLKLSEPMLRLVGQLVPHAPLVRASLLLQARPRTGLKFIGLRDAAHGPRALFRVCGGVGIGYIELVVARVGEGPTRIVDAYAWSPGILVSERMERSIPDQVILDILNGLKTPLPGDLLAACERDPFSNLIKLATAKRYAEVPRLFEENRESLSGIKAAHVVRILALTETDLEAHPAAVDDAKGAFPEDPCIDLAAFAGFVRAGDMDQARACAERLGAKTGDQPGADSLLALALWTAGTLDEAETVARRALEADPSLDVAWIALIGTAVARPDLAQATDHLSEAEDVLGGPIECLEATPGLEKLISSAEYKAWRHSHAGK